MRYFYQISSIQWVVTNTHSPDTLTPHAQPLHQSPLHLAGYVPHVRPVLFAPSLEPLQLQV